MTPKASKSILIRLTEDQKSRWQLTAGIRGLSKWLKSLADSATSGPVMLRKCGWCGADMGTKPCDPAMAGQTSHAICETCVAKITETLSKP